MKNLIILTILWMTIGSFGSVDTARAMEQPDKTDEMGRNSSATFAPRYVRQVEGSAIGVTMQTSRNEFLQDMAATQAQKTEPSPSATQPADNTKAALNLQKKSGPGGRATNKTVPSGGQTIRLPESAITIGVGYDVPIGTGELQCWAPIDANGQTDTNRLYNGARQNETDRLVAEYFNGVRHIYVGFNEVGVTGDTVLIDNPNYDSSIPESPDNPRQVNAWSAQVLQKAIDMSERGDVIIAGVYYYLYGNIDTDKNPRIYGGYYDDGHREKWTYDNSNVGVSWFIGNITIRHSPDAPSGDYAEINNFVLVGSLVADSSNFFLTNNITYNYPGSGYNDYQITAQGSYVNYYDGDNLYFTFTNFNINTDTTWSGPPGDQSVHSPQQEIYVLDAGSSPSTGTGYESNRYDYRKTESDSFDYNEQFSDEVQAIDDFNKGIQGSSLESLFTNKYWLKRQKKEDDIQEAATGALKKSWDDYTLSIYLNRIEGAVEGKEAADILKALADALKNPTEGQKEILAALQAILDEVNNQEEGPVTGEAKKEADEFARIAAKAMLAQAIPDLLKEGDVADIKNIFQELIKAKDDLMAKYRKAMGPYYNKVKEELAKNFVTLKLNNIIFNVITEKELMNLKEEDVDRIIERLKRSENKTPEEESILQKASGYRKEYLDPEKRALEREMRFMLKTFSHKMSKTLKLLKQTTKKND